ncbi:ScyD/ScyE family protein [Mumia sp.]|uniref:ScyD/ScyE family protein n=1 Tax=Mumia sp. TaxID=1965300 RepID=UPI00260860E0|nr:ScyD/ScyE family protein [Mumia sp.]MDD9350330.1 ScyD/ScyE family protein [Mumia sp.]
MRRLPAVVLGAAAALGLALTLAPAQAHGGHRPAPPPAPTSLAEGLLTPLSLAVAQDGTTYVTQNFAGTLSRVSRRGGAPREIYSSGGPEVGGVSVSGRTVYFAETGFSMDPEVPSGFTGIKAIDARGNVRVVADTGTYEERNNPDGDVEYGARDISDECLAQVPTGPEYPPMIYTGDINPHPYATLPGPRGTVYVADAGANSIQRIDRRGRVTTLAILPPVPATITAENAEQFGLPDCIVGLAYWGDPVPTDLEWGPDGWIYLTLLPGGLEAPGTAAVYKVHPGSGRFKKVSAGFSTATNLALTPKGDIYVTELYAGRIALLKRGARTITTFAEANLPAAVEVGPRGLYATTSALVGAPQGPEPPSDPPGGMLVKYPLPWGYGHNHR